MPLDAIHNGRGFFSDYWLGSVLGSKKSHGPRITPAEARALMRRLIQLWQRVDIAEPLPLTDFREKFARPLLGDIFGYSILEAEDDTRIRLLIKKPDADAGSASSAETLSVVLLLPDNEDVEDRATRNAIDKALLDHNLPDGFIMSSEVIRLVRRPGDGPKNAYFDFSVAVAAERDDVESLAVAWRIMNALSFAASAEGRRPIDILEEESRRYSASVSEDLKLAVFSAAEMLIRAFLDDMGRRPNHFTPPPSLLKLRDTALLCLYRLLFIFYAESRDERLQGHKLYFESYSLEGLVGRLLRCREELIPANRCSHWAQIQALFKIYDQGLPPMPDLENIPPRGGRLFNAETDEGRLIDALQLSDRAVAGIVLALAVTRPRKGVGKERISFRELEIEQLGAVYEGLLEYEPCIAKETMIEARVQGKEYVLSPAELLRLCRQKELMVKGDAEIVAETDAAILHPEFDEEAYEEDETELEVNGDEEEEEEEKGVKKGAPARLIRRLEAGDFYFVPGSARKASGSYYTCEEIVSYLVRNSLEDLVKGKSSTEIESLRIIDPACGSGHFLVGAARYLGQTLHEAYRRELKGDPPADFYPGRDLTAQVRERWEKEGAAWCKRRIVEKCLFGVDLNPTAVQLAQVALWIESLAGDRPLSFFDHHIRCGNSLLGTWLASLHEPPHPGYEGGRGQRGLFEQNIDHEIARALDERLLIDLELPREVAKDTPAEYEYKAHRFENAEKLVVHARLLFDLRNAAAFLPAIWSEWANILSANDLHVYVEGRPWKDEFQRVRDRERFFHWELQFPEVFRGEKRGFDAVLGNPPWEKVKPDRKEFYGASDVLIRAYAGGELDVRIKELQAANPTLVTEFKSYSEAVRTVAACLKGGGDYLHGDWEIDGRSTGGDPDLFKFFVERGHLILRRGGRLGFLVPSAIYNNEGCTGLRHLLLDKSKVKGFYGFENRRKIFKIDSRYKFVCLVMEKTAETWADIGTPPDAEFPAAFMRHDVEELENGPPKGIEVIVKRSELEKLSPGTLAFLEYRTERDREIILKMYGLLPGMKKRPLLGDQGEGTWNAKFYCEFHMTNDRDLWTKPDGKLWTPKEVCGRESDDFNDIRELMERKGFWPLYQDAHIHQYVLEFKPLMRWVSLEAHEKKYGRQPSAHRKFVIRDPARNTDERTCIAVILPTKSCFGHTLNGLKMPEGIMTVALGMLNSVCFDYLMRKRVGGQHVSPYLFERAAVPKPGVLASLIAKVPILHANQRKTWIYDQKQFWEQLLVIESTIASSYGLAVADVLTMLEDFPVFARKRPAFYAFLMDRLREWEHNNA